MSTFTWNYPNDGVNPVELIRDEGTPQEVRYATPILDDVGGILAMPYNGDTESWYYINRGGFSPQYVARMGSDFSPAFESYANELPPFYGLPFSEYIAYDSGSLAWKSQYNNLYLICKDGSVDKNSLVDSGLTWPLADTCSVCMSWDEWEDTWGLPEEILQQNRLVFVKADRGLSDTLTRKVLVGGGNSPQAEVDELLIERMHIPFPRGDIMDWDSIKQISFIAPKVRKENPEFYIDIWLGTQDDIDSPIRWYGPKRWRPGKKNVFFDRSGRFISIRARMPSDKDFRLTGYDIEYKLVSRR